MIVSKELWGQPQSHGDTEKTLIDVEYERALQKEEKYGVINLGEGGAKTS